MILAAQPKQFKLQDDGQIFFQADASNPLPGQAIARVAKGPTLLQPAALLLESPLPANEDRDAVADHISTWLKAHIYTVLEPLFTLVADETMTSPSRSIALKLFEGTGIVARTEVDDLIETLDADGRRELRQKKVKLGPLLVFLPELNKPAGVRLRALLWSLYNDQPLPAQTPRDGAMSVTIDPATANTDFYKAVGYPVYGPRAIRIDMLDRVINAIYDSADKGKFRADHKMAEWMGCGIADLYAILSAMGHKHIVPEVKAEEPKAEEAPTPAAETEGEAVPAAEATEEAPAPVEVKKEKPQLDEFILRRGKAHKEGEERKPREAREPREFKPREKTEFKPREKKEFPKERQMTRPGEKPKFDKDKKFGDKKFDKKKFGDKKEERSSEPRTFSANAKVEDNPFAILQQLKK